MFFLLKLAIFFIIYVSVIEGITFKVRRGPPVPDTPKRASPVHPKWHTITQRIDHFDPTDLRNWTMRYISNNQFFKNGGPMIIFLGGEWEIEPDFLLSGQIYDIAKKHEGYMFYTEHRYYGKSYPTENSSTENLRYLSVDQALADVVYFIDYIKETTRGLENSKVVVLGCSYSASMATWLRSKYPHTVDIAYASSGPVRAVVDFHEYLEVVGESIGSVSKNCLEIIRNGTLELEAKLETKVGIEEMNRRFNMCSTIINEEPHRSNFFGSVVVDVFSEMVQYAKPTDIQDTCQELFEAKGTALDKLIALAKSHNEDEKCVESYDEEVAVYKNENITKDSSRSWYYQTCTEFGFYQSTSSSNQPFSRTNPLEYYTNMCQELFGKNFGRDVIDEGIKRTNLFYGSVHPEVTKLISVHGTIDPWYPLGIIEDLNPLAPAILINGTSHCADLYSVSFYDAAALKAAKTRVKELIAEWLAE